MLHRAFTDFILEGHRVRGVVPALVWPRQGVNFTTFVSKSQDWPKQLIFSVQLLGDDGGAMSPTQKRVRSCYHKSRRGHSC